MKTEYQHVTQLYSQPLIKHYFSIIIVDFYLENQNTQTNGLCSGVRVGRKTGDIGSAVAGREAGFFMILLITFLIRGEKNRSS